MKLIETKLKLHTPWYRRTTQKMLEMNMSENFPKEMLHLEKCFHSYKCGDLCDIYINNQGNIKIKFHNDCDMHDAMRLISIITYFISICSGYNCKFDTKIKFDGKRVDEFMDFPKEDEHKNSFKDIKFHEISLQEISDKFGEIIFNLYSHQNHEFILSVLSNYYSMIFYKDFIGNGTYQFRNIITNLEALITIINKKKYDDIIKSNKAKYKELIKTSGKQIEDFSMNKRVSLQEKLKDLFELIENEFGISLNQNINNETLKLANTRNFISHLFDDDTKEYLTHDEMCNYTTSLQEIFRMLFLYHVGIDTELIKIKFVQNAAIRLKLYLNFNFESFSSTNDNS